MSPQRLAASVFVRGLEVQAGIGVYAHEQGRLQTLLVDVDIELSTGGFRNLADTFNYETVAAAARVIVASGHVELVETFAERLAIACFDDARTREVRVRVSKPGALPDAAAAGCEVVFAR